MEIKINKLRMRNFKGCRSAEYILSGSNARLEGPNGSGKSTVFDAFTWLLFGKDHKGQSANAFEIKTLDPATGLPTPKEEHWVEAELVVDGQPKTLKRVWSENWVKPAGELEEVMRGNVSTFYVDGVDVGTQKAYDAVVSAMMGEDMFKMLTNPHYFIDDDYTQWKARRKAIMELVKDAPERNKVREEFADVINALSGRSVEEYRKRLVTEKNANKNDLRIIQNKIAGIRDALPEKVDEAAIKKELDDLQAERDRIIADYQAEIKIIDDELAGGGKANAQRKAESDAIWAKVSALQNTMNNRINAALAEARQKNKDTETRLFEAKANLNTTESKLSSLRMSKDNLDNLLASYEASRGKEATALAELGAQYDKEKAKAFKHTAETTCPYCGQELPAATVEEAREKAHKHFLSERKEVIAGIISQAERIRANVKRIDEEIAKVKPRLSELSENIVRLEAEQEKQVAEVTRLSSTPLISLGDLEKEERNKPDFRKMAVEEWELRIKADKLAETKEDADQDAIKQDRSRYERLISSCRVDFNLKAQQLRDKLAVNSVRVSQEAAIKKMEQEARCFVDVIAQDERLEARAAEFVKAEIDSVEHSLEGIFHVARWKMFDRTLEGGLVEMCEVMSPDGVPYRSMNDAMKILCGMDVIRAFSQHYGMQAPIFIDNAESIIQDRFETSSQVIRLVVKDVPEITLTKE